MIADNQIDKWLNDCIVDDCKDCPFYQTKSCTRFLECLIQLKFKKDMGQTQLRQLLMALYEKTDNEEKSFTIYRSDIEALFKDYKVDLLKMTVSEIIEQIEINNLRDEVFLKLAEMILKENKTLSERNGTYMAFIQKAIKSLD